MPDLLENPPAKRGFFTADNARRYALLSHASRNARAAIPPSEQTTQQPAETKALDPRLVRVLSQIDTLDNLLAKPHLDAKEWDMLTRAKERLFKAWVHLAGIPGPGNRKPPPERRHVNDVPLQPRPACVPDTTTNSVNQQQPVNETPQGNSSQ